MDLQDVKTYAKKLSQGTFKDYTVGLLHGRMSGAQKEQVMNDFKEHKIDLLVSTTVVEVGVDVPNAAIMVIENADRLVFPSFTSFVVVWEEVNINQVVSSLQTT